MQAVVPVLDKKCDHCVFFLVNSLSSSLLICMFFSLCAFSLI